MGEDKFSGRQIPPDDEDDWLHIWSGVEKAHDAWQIIGPVFAVVKNWKFYATVVAVYVVLRRPDIASALDAILGAPQ